MEREAEVLVASWASCSASFQRLITVTNLAYVSTGQAGAAALPYVVAMDLLSVQILPGIVNAIALEVHFPLLTATCVCPVLLII
jgi:hypothetical protein